MKVHVYRNREDDNRRPDEMCYRRASAWWPKGTCACRFCRAFGFFTEEDHWQPS